ncbi:uncharacterized protein BDR25DRAFT_313770 [Lindgomyces ingoldianus]|uniref:Uncharacterized protein n=1 Tax=Lindgomyces ingoldianus TaxID=673940 RepID=A0ACB6QVU4_9PLEO|nr:uncharacterized protein BDR25DRAFT_313770 [Lindgomyces ingoldianus]KAF2471138.1 hypothetical protein BDR25DRAFT_313770 [Lindgomyces ingoldianus]
MQNIVYGNNVKNITVDTIISYFWSQFQYVTRGLVIFYGVSAFVTAVCLEMGFQAMLKTNRSFSHNFPGVFWFVRRLELDFDASKDERRVADPLPKEFRDIVLRQEHISRGGLKRSTIQ